MRNLGILMMWVIATIAVAQGNSEFTQKDKEYYKPNTNWIVFNTTNAKPILSSGNNVLYQIWDTYNKKIVTFSPGESLLIEKAILRENPKYSTLFMYNTVSKALLVIDYKNKTIPSGIPSYNNPDWITYDE